MKRLALFILPVAMLALLTGVWAGWLRIGWQFGAMPNAVAQHGVLMVGGFLGTLICVERIVFFKRFWAWLAPLGFVASVPLQLVGYVQVGYILLMAGSVGYLILMSLLCKKFPSIGQALMLIGAVFQLLASIVLFMTYSYPMAFAGWMAFFLFTIIGERLDLTRFMPVSTAQKLLLIGLLVSFLGGMFLYHRGFQALEALSLIGIAWWLMRFDIAFINIKHGGLHRFLGINLLLAYNWLIITAFLSLFGTYNALMYDAVLHSFFIGFVLSMVMAHAPIILPGVIGSSLRPYHRYQYTWVVLLHLSLALRIGGDITENVLLRQWGGLLNGIAFVAYLLTTALLFVQMSRKKRLNTLIPVPQT